MADRLGDMMAATREELSRLTRAELNEVIRWHGYRVECWGWGAHRSGTEDAGLIECSSCGRLRRSALWFFDDEGEEMVRCARCAAIDHLAICNAWEAP